MGVGSSPTRRRHRDKATHLRGATVRQWPRWREQSLG
jgi:hypothetical protein